MSVVNPDDYRQGGVPTVFEDRTIFPPPEVIGQRVQEKEKVATRQSPVMGIVALLALGGCGFLGWNVMQLQNEISGIQEVGTADEIADLNGVIRDLRVEIADLNDQQAQFAEFGNLLEDAAGLREQIDELVSQPQRVNLPRDLRELIKDVPEDWSDPSKAILADYLQGQRDARTAIRNWPPRPTQQRSTNPTTVD